MREHACLFLLHSFSSIPLDLERSSRRLPNVRDGRSALLTDARPQRRGIIFDQDAETPLCAGGVSQESRWRIRGEPPPRAASRPSALAGTPEHPASASSTRHREFSIAGSGAHLRRRGTVRSDLGRCRNVRPSNPYGLHPCTGRGRAHERTAQQAEYRSAGVRGEGPYLPHLTIVKMSAEQPAQTAFQMARQRWSHYSGSRRILLERLTFVREDVENHWVDLAPIPLGRRLVSR